MVCEGCVSLPHFMVAVSAHGTLMVSLQKTDLMSPFMCISITSYY